MTRTRASSVPASPKSLLRIPAVSNTLPNTKGTMTGRVHALGGVFSRSSRFSEKPAFGDPKLEGLRSAIYDIDTKGPSATLTSTVAMSPIKYKASFESKADRFRRPDGAVDLTYTVDSGNKVTLTTSVEQSPQKYSTMRSPVPRFRPTTAPDTAHLGPGYVDTQLIGPRPKTVVAQRSPRFEPDRPSQGGGSYDVDAGPKASVATSVSQSPRVYSSLSSKVERFKDSSVDPITRDAMQRLQYDVDAGHKKSLATAVATSQVKYAASFDSTAPKLLPTTYGRDAGLMDSLGRLSYDPDQGVKMSLSTSVALSPTTYASLRSPSRRFHDEVLVGSATDLGPGFHDTTRAEAAVGRKQVVLPLPQSERFDRRTDPAKFLGSTYKLEQDSKVWNDVGFAAVKSERPPLNTSTPVDQLYVVDQGPKMSLSTSVARSPQKYSTALASGAPRLVSKTIMAQGDPRFSAYHPREDAKDLERGPGQYDPKIKQDSKPVGITIREPARPHASLASSAQRFQDTGDRNLAESLRSVDYGFERFGTIAMSVSTTERAYSNILRGTGRD